MKSNCVIYVRPALNEKRKGSPMFCGGPEENKITEQFSPPHPRKKVASALPSGKMTGRLAEDGWLWKKCLCVLNFVYIKHPLKPFNHDEVWRFFLGNWIVTLKFYVVLVRYKRISLDLENQYDSPHILKNYLSLLPINRTRRAMRSCGSCVVKALNFAGKFRRFLMKGRCKVRSSWADGFILA